jgi:hypothetical protein
MDHKIPPSLHPSCHHSTRLGARSAILHTMMFLWPWTVMTFPSIAPRRWRSMSLSTSESLVILVYTCKWRCKPSSTHRLALCITSLVTSGLTRMLQTFKLGGGAKCPGMSPHSSHFIPRFSSYLVTCLGCWSYHYQCHDC